MTISKAIPRFVLPGLMLSTFMAAPLAAAPGFAPMRPVFGIGPRAVVAPRMRPGLRGGGDLRHGRRDGGGRFAGGVVIGILPVVPPVEPVVAGPVWLDDGTTERAGEHWAWGEPPEHAACIRPLIIDLRDQPRTRQARPRVIYGTAPPVCPRS